MKSQVFEKINRLNKMVLLTQHIESELHPLDMADETGEFSEEVHALQKANSVLQDAVMRYANRYKKEIKL